MGERDGRWRAIVLASLLTGANACLIDNPSYEAGAQAVDDAGDGTTTATATATSNASTSTTTATGGDAQATSLATSGTTSGGTTQGVLDTGREGSGTGTEPMACSPWDQSPCPDDEGCKPLPGPDEWDTAQCVPLHRRPAPVWELCSPDLGMPGADGCEAGLLCFAAEQPELRICTPMCQGDAVAPTCEHPGTTCTLFGDALFGLCLPDCSPLGNDCGPGQGCYAGLLQGEPPVSLRCEEDLSEGVGGVGDPCQAPNECTPGLACVTADLLPSCPDSACCTAHCIVGMSDCTDGMACVELWEPGKSPPPPSLAGLGICVETA